MNVNGYSQGKNHLSSEKSVYLQQHAENPVDWYPWGELAFEKAREENKLIVLSIGYSACHWCHRMENEAFSDSSIAAFMNANFVSIKVDKEERPDVDKAHSRVVQLIKGTSGWPLNCILLPNAEAIYGGSYFEKAEWIELLKNMVEIQRIQPEKLVEFASKISEELNKPLFQREFKPNITKVDSLPKLIGNEIISHFDWENGGFGSNPKFPSSPKLASLYALYNWLDADSLKIAFTDALSSMQKGAVYDHIQGGFSRYSSGASWNNPHFEKMLYDNAQLMSCYAAGYKITKNIEYKRVINEIYDFACSQMSSKKGGFYSSIGAMLKDVNGGYYFLTEEARTLLRESDIDYFQEIKVDGSKPDQVLLVKRVELSKLALAKGIPSEELEKRVDGLRRSLSKYRVSEDQLEVDTKIIVSWNALMISSLTKAYEATGEKKYLERARKGMRYIQKHFINDSIIRHTNDEKSTICFLEDYSYLTRAYLDLYRVTFETNWLQEAEKMAIYSLSNFIGVDGLFLSVKKNNSELMYKDFALFDKELPSANAVMIGNLIELNELIDISNSAEVVSRSLEKMNKIDPDYYSFMGSWSNSILKGEQIGMHVMIVGENAEKFRSEFAQNPISNIIVSGAVKKETLKVHSGKYQEGKTLFYLCKDKSCLKPVENVSELFHLIEIK